MVQLVLGDLLGEGAGAAVGESDAAAAGTLPGVPGRRYRRRQAFAGHRAQVELGFEVFQVQREVQDVDIGDRRGICRGGSGGEQAGQARRRVFRGCASTPRRLIGLGATDLSSCGASRLLCRAHR